MKRLIVIAAMIAAFGLGGAAAFAATADKPSSPPGQGPCDHGNGDQNGNAGPCKEDPSPNGKDCEEHGNKGGVNEDHCLADTTTTDTTTTTETTTTETTTTETTTESTPTESTPTESTPTQTSSTETTPETETIPASEDEQPAQEPGVFTPPTQKASASTTQLVSAGSGQAAAKPSTAAQPAPFTP